MTRTSIIRAACTILKVIGGVALAVFLFMPFRGFGIVLMYVSLVLGVICIGGAHVLGLELEIPNPPNNSKRDPSRPLGL